MSFEPRVRTPGQHYPVLDGWRAASILFVLAGHMLPLGPKNWAMNGAVATSGMAIFFTLSGFLIVNLLLHDPRALPFLTKRVFRIVPLAWLYLFAVLSAFGASSAVWAGNLLFFANVPPFFLAEYAGHFWSLCVEMQFYVGIAMVVALLGKRGLWVIPILAVAITAHRVIVGEPLSIVTWHRLDEILAGGCLALVVASHGDRVFTSRALLVLPFILFALLITSAHESGGALRYARPYLAAAMVGATLFACEHRLRLLLSSKAARYVARTSYALYVFHPITMYGWLNEGAGITKYFKRPISFALTFGLAHVSTFKYEAWWNARGHALAAHFQVPRLRGTG